MARAAYEHEHRNVCAWLAYPVWFVTPDASTPIDMQPGAIIDFLGAPVQQSLSGLYYSGATTDGP